MIQTAKGMLVEYALSLPPLVLEFELNPETLATEAIRHHRGTEIPLPDRRIRNR